MAEKERTLGETIASLHEGETPDLPVQVNVGIVEVRLPSDASARHFKEGMGDEKSQARTQDDSD